MTTLQDHSAPLDSMIATEAEPAAVAGGGRPGLMAQLWRGSTRVADRHVFASLVQAKIQAALSRSEACKGAYVLQRQVRQGEVETLVLMLHEGASVAGGGGREPDLVVMSEAEKRLLIACDGSATRYDVLTDSRRALSYADLLRRFPLRMMAPR